MMMFSPSVYRTVLISIAVLFTLVHTWAYVNSVYHNVPLIDVPMHMLFGAWLALLLLHPRFIRDGKTPLIVFAIVTAVGIGWECIEYFYDTFLMIPRGLPTAQHGIVETLRDMMSNTLGAGAIIFFNSRFFKRNDTAPQKTL